MANQFEFSFEQRNEEGVQRTISIIAEEVSPSCFRPSVKIHDNESESMVEFTLPVSDYSSIRNFFGSTLQGMDRENVERFVKKFTALLILLK